MLISKRVLYSGRVQGVGFRYTAQRLAQGRPVAGYVRNLPDGRVELAAEGEAEAVNRFLDEVARRMEEYISRQTVTDETPGGYQEFHIRH